MGSAAPGQMKGYIYQIQVALFHFLKNIDKFSDETEIRLENYDDVNFSKTESPQDVLQAKHSIHTGTLSNGSKNLWKTFSNWSDLCNKENLWDNPPSFYLITTDSSSKNSIAWFLSEGGCRDESAAIESINRVIQKKPKAIDNKNHFVLLGDEKKELLIDHVFIITDNPQIQNIEETIKKYLLDSSILPNSADSLREEFINWWYGESIRSLNENERISKKRIVSKFQELQTKNGKKLQIDKDYVKTTQESLFLKQLEIINYPSQKESATDQFCWAFYHRGLWLKNTTVTDTELQKYDEELNKEYQIQKSSSDFISDEKKDENKGQWLYNNCVVKRDYDLVNLHDCTDRQLLRGSYQILANDKKIGWHPNYENLI